MNVKKKKEIEIKEIKAPASSVFPLFSNLTVTHSHEDMILIDFGFIAPSYIEESDDLEDTQIARICLSWSAAEILSKDLAQSVKSHSVEITKKRAKTKKD